MTNDPSLRSMASYRPTTVDDHAPVLLPQRRGASPRRSRAHPARLRSEARERGQVMIHEIVALATVADTERTDGHPVATKITETTPSSPAYRGIGKR